MEPTAASAAVIVQLDDIGTASIATRASASLPFHPQMSPAFCHYRAGHNLPVMAMIAD
jgi:hypothetical protein